MTSMHGIKHFIFLPVYLRGGSSRKGAFSCHDIIKVLIVLKHTYQYLNETTNELRKSNRIKLHFAAPHHAYYYKAIITILLFIKRRKKLKKNVLNKSG